MPGFAVAGCRSRFIWLMSRNINHACADFLQLLLELAEKMKKTCATATAGAKSKHQSTDFIYNFENCIFVILQF